MSNYADRLRIVLRSYQSIRSLAAAVGLPYRTIYNYVVGTREPSPVFLSALARLGISSRWLLTGEGPMYVHELKLHDRYPEVEDKLILEPECAPGFEMVNMPVPIGGASHLLARLGSIAKDSLNDERLATVLEFLTVWWSKSNDEERTWLRVQLRRTLPEFEAWLQSHPTPTPQIQEDRARTREPPDPNPPRRPRGRPPKPRP